MDTMPRDTRSLSLAQRQKALGVVELYWLQEKAFSF